MRQRRSEKSNLLIHAENVEALTMLLKDASVRGKVRLVYIDPPFATNQKFRIGELRTATVSGRAADPVAYSDELTGAGYLDFLRERVTLLRQLLADDGSLYVHIDYKVGHYVKVLLDGIFGSANFRSDITRIKCNPKNFARRGYGNIKDMILFYTKSARFVWNEPREEMAEEDIERLFPKHDANGRRYTTNPLHAPGETRRGATGQSWKGRNPPPGRHWRVPPEELTRMERLHLIEWSSNGNPRKKIFADETGRRGKRVQDVWEFKDPPYPAYPTQKNIAVLRRIIAASSNPGDLVLDCFAGSGTTLLAAQELGRRWIGIDNSIHAIRVARERLRGIGGPVLLLHGNDAAPKRN